MPVSVSVFWCDEFGIGNIVEGVVECLKIVVGEVGIFSGNSWHEGNIVEGDVGYFAFFEDASDVSDMFCDGIFGDVSLLEKIGECAVMVPFLE